MGWNLRFQTVEGKWGRWVEREVLKLVIVLMGAFKLSEILIPNLWSRSVDLSVTFRFYVRSGGRGECFNF